MRSRLPNSLILAAALLVAARPLAAQKPLISQTALITIVQNHKGAVLRYIDAAPDSMLGFCPTKGVRTFAEQIAHAAGSDAFIAHLAINGSTKGMPAMGDTAVYLHNKAALKAYAAAAMDETITLLRGVSDAAMQQEINQFGNKVTRARRSWSCSTTFHGHSARRYRTCGSTGLHRRNILPSDPSVAAGSRDREVALA